MMIFLAWLNQFTGWLVLASIKSLLLIFLILFVRLIFRKQLSAVARFSLWFCLLISLCIPLGWKIAFNESIPSSEVRLEQTAGTPDTYANPSPQLNESSSAKTTNSYAGYYSDTFFSWPNYQNLFSIIWFLVLIVIFSITIYRLRMLSSIQHLSIAADQQQNQQLEKAKTILDCNKKIILLYSSSVESPFTFGFFKSRIIFPANIDKKLTEEQLWHVLLHEVAHIKRHDILWNWIGYWICAMHWFNPFVWFAMNRMKNDMEMACDAMVLKRLPPVQHSRYGFTLIEASQYFLKSPKGISLGILDNYRDLKNRITMIREFTAMNIKKSLVFILVFSILTISALAQPEQATTLDVKNKPSTEEKNNITLFEFATRVQNDLNMSVLVGQNFSSTSIPVNLPKTKINYGQFLSQLKINGFTAYKNKDYIQIVTIPEARSYAIPIVEKNKTYFEDEYVTDTIKLEKACAGSILAVVRPMAPQAAFMTVLESANTLIISDFYQNIQRIKSTIKTLESNIQTPCDLTQKK